MLKTKKQMLKNRLLKDFSVVLAAGAGAAAAVLVASSTVPAAAAALGFTSRIATTSKAGDTGHQPDREPFVVLKEFPETGELGAIFEIKFNETKDTIEKIEGFWTENPSVQGQEPEGVNSLPFITWDANVESALWNQPTYDPVEFSPENPTEITKISNLLLPSKQTTDEQNRDLRLNFYQGQGRNDLQGFFRFRDEDGDPIRYEGFATSNFGESNTVSVAEPSLTLGFITLASLMLGSRKKKEAKKT